MEKPGNRLVAFAIFVIAIGALAYVVNHEHGLANEVVAAYLQAVGSVAAITAAIWIANGEARRDREARHSDLCERLETLVHIACVLAYITSKLRDRVDGLEPQGISTNRLEGAIKYLDAIPATAMGPVALDGLNIASQCHHLLVSWKNWVKSVKRDGVNYNADDVLRVSTLRSATVVRDDATLIEETARRMLSTWLSVKDGAPASPALIEETFVALSRKANYRYVG